MKKNIAERCVDLFVQVRWRRRGSNRRTDTTPDSLDSFKLGYECSGNIFGRMPMKIKKIKSQKKTTRMVILLDVLVLSVFFLGAKP